MSARLSGGERVLVRAPSWVGDFVAAEPAIRALVLHQGARGSVSVAAPARLLGLLGERFPDLRRLPIAPELPEGGANWRGHDVALLLNGSFGSAWRAWRSGIGIRAGFARGGRGAVLTHAYAPARERGAKPLGLGRAGGGPRFLPRPFGAACAELLGWLGVAVRERAPRLLVPGADRERAAARLAAAGLGPGEPFVLARTVLLDAPPSDLAELAALSASARLAVGPDNGARHVAQALGTPCIALCGPTDPRHTAEHPATTRLLSVEVPCGPCHRETCPLAGDLRHACMHRIEPARVAAAAAELLG